jgi:hypothetical protein
MTDNGHEHVLIDDGSGNILGPFTPGSAAAPNAIPIYDAYVAPAVANWMTGTAVNTTQAVTTSGMDTVIVTLVANASVTGGAVTFEVYDGAAWLPVKAPTIIDYTTVSSAALTASYSKGFQVPVAGFPSFRVRLSSALTGAGAALVSTIIVSSAPDTSLVTTGQDPSSTAAPVGSGSFATGQATVGVSAAVLVAARTGAGGNGAGSAGVGRIAVTITNNGAATIYIGNSGVTTGTGKSIGPGNSLTLNTTAAIYAISGTAGQAVDYVETF